MTVERRLARLEAALSPTELVLRWLDEAHAAGGLEAYVRAQLTDPAPEGPLDRLAREAATGARATARGKGTEAVDACIRSAVRETVFRFELVLRINVTTHELLDREALIDAAFSAHLALLAVEGRTERPSDTVYHERLATCRDGLALRVGELRAAAEARDAVEGRYLAGHPAVFPDSLKGWDDQLASTKALADLAVRLAELYGLPAAASAAQDAFPDRVTKLTADLVEPARATALEKLGEGERAIKIAGDWLMTTLRPVPS